MRVTESREPESSDRFSGGCALARLMDGDGGPRRILSGRTTTRGTTSSTSGAKSLVFGRFVGKFESNRFFRSRRGASPARSHSGRSCRRSRSTRVSASSPRRVPPGNCTTCIGFEAVVLPARRRARCDAVKGTGPLRQRFAVQAQDRRRADRRSSSSPRDRSRLHRHDSQADNELGRRGLSRTPAARRRRVPGVLPSVLGTFVTPSSRRSLETPCASRRRATSC